MKGGLVVRLKPHERFLVNGAILENGDRRSKIHVRSQDVNILRLRDAMHPEEAKTPVTRLYYSAQLAVIGEQDSQETRENLLSGLNDLVKAMPDAVCSDIIMDAISRAQDGEFFRVMTLLKKLIPIENKIFSLSEKNATAFSTMVTDRCSSSLSPA